MATPHVDPDVFWDLNFPVAPLKEQKRIVEKLDVMLPKVNSAKVRLEKIRSVTKKIRQSVLAAACSGRLTEDWRFDYAQRTGKDLPEWKEGELETFCEIISGNAFKSSDFIKKGIPVIKIANVQYGKYEDDINQEYLPEHFLKECPKFIVNANDVLLALTRPITNDTLKVCLYPDGRENALLNQRVALLKPRANMLKDFLLVYMQSHDFKENIKSNLSETLQPNLSPKDLAKITIVCPTISEQEEIIRRVENLFTLANSFEAKYKKAMERVEKIEQSVLAKAFRGELVEPDPNDESAEELLKRILEEKSKLEGEKKKKKR